MSSIVSESRQRSRSLPDLRLPNTSNDIRPVLEAIQKEMAEMKKNIQKIQKENTSVSNRNKELEKEVHDIYKKMRDSSRERFLENYRNLKPIRDDMKTLKEYVNNELDELNETLTDKIRVIENALDDLEREMKESELEIEELYKLRGENLVRAVMRIGQEIGCSLQASDIKACYRKPSKKDGTLGNVVVKFNELNKRNDFLHSYNANADYTDVCVEVPLTRRSQNLLSMIYESNFYGYYDVFTKNGRVYVQEYFDSEAICVRSEDDLP